MAVIARPSSSETLFRFFAAEESFSKEEVTRSESALESEFMFCSFDLRTKGIVAKSGNGIVWYLTSVRRGFYTVFNPSRSISLFWGRGWVASTCQRPLGRFSVATTVQVAFS